MTSFVLLEYALHFRLFSVRLVSIGYDSFKDFTAANANKNSAWALSVAAINVKALNGVGTWTFQILQDFGSANVYNLQQLHGTVPDFYEAIFATRDDVYVVLRQVICHLDAIYGSTVRVFI